jgi:peptide/nickel transport system permease protein
MMHVRRGPLIAAGAIALIAAVVPLLPLADPAQTELAHHLTSPSLAHPLGQDADGRDVLSLLLWGARTSLFVAVTSALLACVAGTGLGLVGSRLHGVAEPVLAGIMDVLACFPPLLFALLFLAMHGPGTLTLIAVLAVLSVPGFIRVIRTGAGAGRAAPINLRGLAGPLLVRLSFVAAFAVMLESGLSFLGLGVVPPTPSWGRMIATASAEMDQAPLLLLWPCAALSLTILALSALGDALRDAAEPRARRHRVGHAALPPPAIRPASGTAVLDVRNLTVEIEAPHGVVRAVRDVSFSVRAGETVALVGERGSGKSLTGLAIMGLLPDGAHVSLGSAWLQGHNLLRLDEAAFRRVRGGVASMIFQDPQASLNPLRRIGAQIAEAMHAHFHVADYEAKEEVETLLIRVGIADAKRCARAYPHQLSADMQQRVITAMAIANDPRLLIVDEPTATLDSERQAPLLDLLADLRRELGMGLVLLTRSLAVAARIADRVLVMHQGQIIEQGDVRDILAAARHAGALALRQPEMREAQAVQAVARRTRATISDRRS